LKTLSLKKANTFFAIPCNFDSLLSNLSTKQKVICNYGKTAKASPPFFNHHQLSLAPGNEK
jgi:hypothetical protein